MGKKSVRKVQFILPLVFILALTACNQLNQDERLYSIADFQHVKTNEGKVMEGGSFIYGLVSDTAFEGTFNFNFYSGDPDAQILQWFDEPLLTWDENYVYTNDGAATYDISEDGRTFTFKIRDQVNWHDGNPVTSEDWLFAYEVIGHPDYDGVRYGSDFANIVGMEDYHHGKAETISGIEVVDEKTLKITYIEPTPSLVTGGIWAYPLAKHIFGQMKIAHMSSSKEVREHPIGFGPFKVEKIIPGESVILTRNEDYWREKPKLDQVTVKVINPNVIVQFLEKGEVDTVSSFPIEQFPANAQLSNVEYLGNIDRAYTYIGFKLGSWDKEKKEVVTNPNAKMADVELRKAMWHAADNDTVGERLYYGLRLGATTLIPPSHPEFHDESNKGRKYDPELAKKLLDDAGYKDVDGDGFREDRKGKKLVIHFATVSGDDTAEPLAQYYIQAWKAVGLRVELLDGRLQEFNTFYERIGQKGEDDPEIDMYQGAWGVGTDVDPTGLYGRNALFNFTRWSSKENDRLLAAGVSEAAFDVERRKEIYKEWQQLMVDEVPAFPTLYRSVLVPVNNRVHNYSIGDGTGMYLYELAVTQEKPISAK